MKKIVFLSTLLVSSFSAFAGLVTVNPMNLQFVSAQRFDEIVYKPQVSLICVGTGAYPSFATCKRGQSESCVKFSVKKLNENEKLFSLSVPALSVQTRRFLNNDDCYVRIQYTGLQSGYVNYESNIEVRFNTLGKTPDSISKGVEKVLNGSTLRYAPGVQLKF